MRQWRRKHKNTQYLKERKFDRNTPLRNKKEETNNIRRNCGEKANNLGTVLQGYKNIHFYSEEHIAPIFLNVGIEDRTTQL
jgi:hypothetical protein